MQFKEIFSQVQGCNFASDARQDSNTCKGEGLEDKEAARHFCATRWASTAFE